MQTNAYEEGDMIHAAMISVNDSSPYTVYAYISRRMSPVSTQHINRSIFAHKFSFHYDVE